MIDNHDDKKEKDPAAYHPEPAPHSPPPIYGASPSTPPPPNPQFPSAQPPFPAQPQQAHYTPPGQYSPQYGQFAAQGQPGQYQQGQHAAQPGTPGYFPAQPGTFSPQGQPTPLSPQHTGPLSPHHTGPMSPQQTGTTLTYQNTGVPGQTMAPGQYPSPAGYPPQMSQHQNVAVNMTSPNGTPTVVHSPQVVYTAATPMQMQQPMMTGSQFQQELWARCARGDHDYETKYGIGGIILGILFFPIGLICLFMDVEKKCTRCGAITAA
ncbi:hypothetical protein BXZ70DRAFT_614152 [Cristinia sonorae]|uniref:Uncharacterized protein n=1 Tax=Cristinia sonorae TaxID=1940300 RepID=A0A8K0UUX8_9AGAR|nr:hypothetical protein BXZ70DRAFT_614152 [Cristinia sonorae]